MKFVPKDMGEAADVSASSQGWTSHLKLILAFLAAVVLVVAILGRLMGAAAYYMPDSWETKLAGLTKFSESSLTECDTEQHPYLTELFKDMVKKVATRKLDYRVECLQWEMLNAFALPGGKVILTKGFLDSVKTKEGIAMVLGHELGHHERRHIMQGLVSGLSTGVLLEILGAGDSVAGAISQQIIGLSVLKHSRENEYEADDFGLQYIVGNFDKTESVTEFFELVLQEQKEKGETASRFSEFLSTHPLTEDRIQRIKSNAKLLR